MGIGKQKANAKIEKKKLKAKKNNAKAACTESSDPEALTGRQKHQEKVMQKLKLREMLNNKKAKRLTIKKSTTDSDEKSLRRALCAEIKLLKVGSGFASLCAPISRTAAL